MLNYLKAELYKALHRKYLYVFLLVMLILESCLLFGWWTIRDLDSFTSAIRMVIPMLIIGLYLSVLFVDLVFSDQYKHCTLKNEISYGIMRPTVYCGKFLAALVVAAASCAILIGFYLLCGRILLPVGAEDGTALHIFLYSIGVAFPLWAGALSLTMLSFFLLRSSTAAAMVVAVFLSIGGPVLDMLGNMLRIEVVSPVAAFLYRIMPSTPLGELSGVLDWALMGRAWGIGLGWLAVTLLLGVVIFRKREIS